MSLMDNGDLIGRVLSFSLLGPISILGENLQPLKFRSSRDQALLIYLATESGLGISTHRREKLMNLLWADFTQKSAQVNLRQALYHLRKTVAAIPQPAGGDSIPILLSDRQTVQFNQAYSINLDIAEFTRLLKDHQDGWPQAVELYRGDFLSDFYLPDSNPFEDWAVTRRESFRLQVLDALTGLAAIKLEERSYLEAEHYARQQLELDRLRENAYRQLMTALAHTGQRSQALVLFDSCRKLLQTELGIDPSAETVMLYEDIRSERLNRGGVLGEISTGHGEPIDVRCAPVRARIVNLPIQPTPLIGRESELAKLDEMISDPDIRLITIVGPGGIGKTRLAIAAGECQLSEESPFTDGVIFLSLAPLDSPDQIIPTMAEGLDFHFETGDRQTRTPRQQLYNFLHPRRLLIIMDNFEHLLEGVDLVTNLVSTAPGLVIIATSQERLHLQQEQVYPIRGLEIPARDDISHKVQKIIEFSAVKFFLKCAKRIQPNYELTTGDINPLHQICQLVEGMPLALELAASWVNLLSLSDIAAEIQQGLAILQAEQRDMPRRHWNMRAVFDGTWKRLTELERRIFSQISVFRGGFDRQAAQAVTNASLPLLAGLVDKSLLSYDKVEDRYRIHELLRQYAADKLAGYESAEAQVRGEHSDYYCRWLSEREADLRGECYRVTLTEIESDIENVRTAWSWAVAKRNIGQIETATDSLGRIYESLGRYQEGEQAIHEAVDALWELSPPNTAPEHPQTASETKLLIRLLTWGATYQSKMGMSDNASQLLSKGLKLLDSSVLEGHDIRKEKAFIFSQRGDINRDFDPVMAYEILMESAELYRDLGDQRHLAYVLNVSGNIARFRGMYEYAYRLLEECREIEQKLDDPRLIARTLTDLSMVAYSKGDLKKGEILARQGYQAHQDAGGLESIAAGKMGYGMAHYFHGQFGEAYPLFQSCKDIFEAQAQNSEIARATTEIGICLFHLGKYERAYPYGQRGLALYEGLGLYANLEHARLMQSWMALGIGSTLEAERLGRQAVIGSQINGDIRREGLGSAILGFTLRAVNNRREARAFLRRSLQIGREIGAYQPLVFGLPVVALLLVDKNQIERAVEIYSLVESHPIVGHSRWWRDAVGREIDLAGSSLPPSVFEAAKTRGKSLDLWEVADGLMDDFL